MKPAKKTDPAVEVVLLDPSGAPADLQSRGGPKKNAFALKGFVVPTTGRWYLRLTPTRGATENVSVTATVAAGTSFGGTVHVDAAAPPTEVEIPVLDGTLATIVVKAAKGSAAQPTIVGLVQNGADVLVEGDAKAKGRTATLKLARPLAAGTARLLLSAAEGTAGDVVWSAKLKQPKTYAFSLDDVASGD